MSNDAKPGTADHTAGETAAAETGRKKPYATPVLKVYGTVAAITATLSMDGAIKDGGPNNIKT